MRKLALGLAAFSTLAIAGFAEPAAAQYCEGKVRGLSNNYNPSTGSGFLSVRAGPTRSATQLGELFNGDTVEIFRRKGNWYKIAAADGSVEGWASVRWIRNDCRY
jgi:SH3-like domain-containing protein